MSVVWVWCGCGLGVVWVCWVRCGYGVGGSALASSRRVMVVMDGAQIGEYGGNDAR